MKRIITILALAAGLVGLVAVPASAARATRPSDCSFSAMHSSLTYPNGLGWSTNRQAHITPLRRSGACGKVYIEFMGVYNAPTCAYFQLVTLNEDRTWNWVGPWYFVNTLGQLVNLRGNGRISNNRLYHIYTYGCGRFRHMNFPPGMNIYTHAA